MKKRLLILLYLGWISIFHLLNAQNQNIKDKIAISFMSGYSQASGIYGSSNILDVQGSDFAQNGIIYQLSGSYSFNKFLGLGLNLSMSSHSINTEAMQKYISFTSPSQYYLIVSKDKYQQFNVGLGPVFKLPVLKWLKFEAHSFIGFLSFKHPDLYYKSSATPYFVAVGILEQTKSSLSYQFGLTTSFHFHPRWAFCVQANHTRGQSKIDFTPSGFSLERLMSADRKITYWNYLGGLNFIF